MTKEELNKWLADEIRVYPGCCSSIECVKYDIARETAIKIAAWKDKQFIEYLTNMMGNADDTTTANYLAKIIQDFKKAMKEK